MKCVLGTTLTVMIAFLVACTGETRSVAHSSGVDGGDGAQPGCSAAGIPTSCDPLVGGGCSEGSCYLVKSLGPACVCPGGGAAEGGSCNTTIECGPGLVCAGTSPPGACRKACDPNLSTCPTGTYCRFITAYPTFGYCDVQ